MLSLKPLRSASALWQLRSISKTPNLPYTKEQQCQVLDLLNTSSEKDLRKLLGPSYITRILHAREESGPFSSLDNVLSIKGLQGKGLVKFCETVLYGAVKTEKRIDKSVALLPILTDERIQIIETVVALDLTLPFVTYTKMDRERNILEWKRFECIEEKSKYHLTSYYETASTIYTQIPRGDIYVIEYNSNHQKQPNYFDRHEVSVKSMLVALLSFGEADQPKVVSVKSNYLNQLFKLNVGSERVSVQKTFKGLVDEGEIKVDEALNNRYLREGNVNKEFLSMMAMQCLSFFRICKL